MSRFYSFLYRVGMTPWEQDSDSLAPQFGTFLDAEEQARGTPYGRALDLGCGRGRWSMVLAKRGWDVVGVDIVPTAVHEARRCAQEADVDIEFFEGDVTALRNAGLHGKFDFFLDVECFNHLKDDQRREMGQEVNALSSTNATMLLLIWSRARRGPFPPGATPQDLTSAFPGWKITDEYPHGGDLPAPLKRFADPRWYRLARS
jgi:SAM-dependent methyltransferase